MANNKIREIANSNVLTVLVKIKPYMRSIAHIEQFKILQLYYIPILSESSMAKFNVSNWEDSQHIDIADRATIYSKVHVAGLGEVLSSAGTGMGGERFVSRKVCTNAVAMQARASLGAAIRSSRVHTEVLSATIAEGFTGHPPCSQSSGMSIFACSESLWTSISACGDKEGESHTAATAGGGLKVTVLGRRGGCISHKGE